MLDLKARGQLSSYWAPGHFPLQADALQISECPLEGIIRVQGIAEAGAFREAVARVVGTTPPTTGQYLRSNQYEFVWSGPREWLLFVPLAKEYQYVDAFREAFQGVFASAAVMSDSRFALEISGNRATALLAKGTGLNLATTDFPAGSATTTRFSGMPALLMHREPGAYRLYFDVSYAAFITAWMLDAAQEFLPTPA